MQGMKNKSVIVGIMLVVAVFLAAAPLPGVRTHTQKEPRVEIRLSPFKLRNVSSALSDACLLDLRNKSARIVHLWVEVTRGLSPLPALPQSGGYDALMQPYS